MKHVYAVEHYPYEDDEDFSYIMRIYANKDNAEEFVKKKKARYGDKYVIKKMKMMVWVR